MIDQQDPQSIDDISNIVLNSATIFAMGSQTPRVTQKHNQQIQCISDMKRGQQFHQQQQQQQSQSMQKAQRVKQIDKSLIKALSVSWREKISQWTPNHLQIMAQFGFNLLAMQEDLVGSFNLESFEVRKWKQVSKMLVLFDVLSIEVVFILLDLGLMLVENNYLYDDCKELTCMKPFQMIEALDKQQMREFCAEQLRQEAPDLYNLSKVIHLQSFCINTNESLNLQEKEEHKDLLQAMIQFCYNDNVMIRVSVLNVFEQALRHSSRELERQELTELLSSVPHILHSQLVQDVSSNSLAFKDFHREALGIKDFKRSVDLIIDILVDLENQQSQRKSISTRQSLKIVTDAPLTLLSVLDTLVLPKIFKETQKDHDKHRRSNNISSKNLQKSKEGQRQPEAVLQSLNLSMQLLHRILKLSLSKSNCENQDFNSSELEFDAQPLLLAQQQLLNDQLSQALDQTIACLNISISIKNDGKEDGSNIRNELIETLIEICRIVFVTGVQINGNNLVCGTGSKGLLTGLIWKTCVSQVPTETIIKKLTVDLVIQSACIPVAKTEGMRTVFYAFTDFLHGVLNLLAKISQSVTDSQTGIAVLKKNPSKISPTVLILNSNLIEIAKYFNEAAQSQTKTRNKFESIQSLKELLDDVQDHLYQTILHPGESSSKAAARTSLSNTKTNANQTTTELSSSNNKVSSNMLRSSIHSEKDYLHVKLDEQNLSIATGGGGGGANSQAFDYYRSNCNTNNDLNPMTGISIQQQNGMTASTLLAPRSTIQPSAPPMKQKGITIEIEKATSYGTPSTVILKTSNESKNQEAKKCQSQLLNVKQNSKGTPKAGVSTLIDPINHKLYGSISVLRLQKDGSKSASTKYPLLKQQQSEDQSRQRINRISNPNFSLRTSTSQQSMRQQLTSPRVIPSTGCLTPTMAFQNTKPSSRHKRGTVMLVPNHQSTSSLMHTRKLSSEVILNNHKFYNNLNSKTEPQGELERKEGPKFNHGSTVSLNSGSESQKVKPLRETAMEQARRTLMLTKAGSPTNRFAHYGFSSSKQPKTIMTQSAQNLTTVLRQPSKILQQKHVATIQTHQHLTNSQQQVAQSSGKLSQNTVSLSVRQTQKLNSKLAIDKQMSSGSAQVQKKGNGNSYRLKADRVLLQKQSENLIKKQFSTSSASTSGAAAATAAFVKIPNNKLDLASPIKHKGNSSIKQTKANLAPDSSSSKMFSSQLLHQSYNSTKSDTLKNSQFASSRTKTKQVTKKHINLPVSSLLQTSTNQSSSYHHSRQVSHTSNSSLKIGSHNPSIRTVASNVAVKKQISMNQMIVTQGQKEMQYVSKVDGKRMIKRVITENLKRSKSKQAQIDAKNLVSQQKKAKTSIDINSKIGDTQNFTSNQIKVGDHDSLTNAVIHHKHTMTVVEKKTNKFKKKTSVVPIKLSKMISAKLVGQSHQPALSDSTSHQLYMFKVRNRSSNVSSSNCPRSNSGSQHDPIEIESTIPTHQIVQYSRANISEAEFGQSKIQSPHRVQSPVEQQQRLSVLPENEIPITVVSDLVDQSQANSSKLKFTVKRGTIEGQPVSKKQTSIISVTSSVDHPGSIVTDYVMSNPKKSSFVMSTTTNFKKQIAEKMYIYSQMQSQPYLNQTLLYSMEQIQKGQAFSYAKRRIQEVTKLSEIEQFWKFLSKLNQEQGVSIRSLILTHGEVQELTDMLRKRIVEQHMPQASEQRYLKLAGIVEEFDDSLRAFDILMDTLRVKEVGDEQVDTNKKMVQLLGQHICNILLLESQSSKVTEENSLIYKLCFRLQKLDQDQPQDQSQKQAAQTELIQIIRSQILHIEDNSTEKARQGTLIWNESQAQLCLRDFIVGMSQPKVPLLHYAATWLFQSSSNQLMLTTTSKLILDGYLTFIKTQKQQNVFYCVPWQTINLLFPAAGQTPTLLQQHQQPYDYCHDRVVDTLHAIAIVMKDLRVLDPDSLEQINAFFAVKYQVSSYFVPPQSASASQIQQRQVSHYQM